MRASLAVVGLALASSGCSLIGLGIGAATPAYDKPTTLSDLETERDAESSEPGPDLHVVARVRDEDVSVDGAYARQTASSLRLKTKRGYATIRTDVIRSIDERSGSRWGTGLLIGAAIDLAVVIMIAAAAPTMTLYGPIRGPLKLDLHTNQTAR